MAPTGLFTTTSTPFTSSATSGTVVGKGHVRHVTATCPEVLVLGSFNGVGLGSRV